LIAVAINGENQRDSEKVPNTQERGGGSSKIDLMRRTVDSLPLVETVGRDKITLEHKKTGNFGANE